MVTHFLKCLPPRFQAEAIGVNMASFRKLLFAFLLLIVLSDIQAGDDRLSCSKHNIAELGRSIKIECKNNAPIDSTVMKFCPLEGDHCSIKCIFREQNITCTDNETTLEVHNNIASLSITQIKISHEGNYKLHYVAENCMEDLNISLEVFAPYTRPQIMKQEDTLICTASGGYPEEKLYWVSKTGTDLTHKSTSQSVKNEDGSFNLSNTLQLQSAPSETEYCCIFSHARIPGRQPASACKIVENVRTSKSSQVRTQETTRNTPGTIGIVIAVIALASILLVVIWWRTGRNNYLLKEKKFQNKARVNHIYTIDMAEIESRNNILTYPDSRRMKGMVFRH